MILYDLPGITNKDEETYKKDNIIIRKFLEPKETISILVHAFTSDFDENECLTIIRKFSKKEKNDIFKRSIPVFAKPDDTLKKNPRHFNL